MRIAVITTTIPCRASMLAECIESVNAQTLKPVEHLIGEDTEYTERNGRIINDLVDRTDCDWFALLADDDLMLPHHIETLAASAEDADIVYSWCEVQGRGDWSPNLEHVDMHNLHIPATALVRKKLWAKVKGYPESLRGEDNLFYNRARDVSARFVLVPKITWVYRFHGANKSMLSEEQGFKEHYVAD